MRSIPALLIVAACGLSPAFAGELKEDCHISLIRDGLVAKSVDCEYDTDCDVYVADPAPGPGPQHYTWRRHLGSQQIDDTWSGTMNPGDFDYVASATSQSQFDSRAGDIIGSWYSAKAAQFAGLGGESETCRSGHGNRSGLEVDRRRRQALGRGGSDAIRPRGPSDRATDASGHEAPAKDG